MGIWWSCDYENSGDSPLLEYPIGHGHTNSVHVQLSTVDDRTQLSIVTRNASRLRKKSQTSLSPKQVRYLIECLQRALDDNSRIKDEE